VQGTDDQKEANVSETLDRVREAIQAQNRAIASMVGAVARVELKLDGVVKTQWEHGEMLVRALEIISEEPPEGESIADRLRALITADKEHATTLRAVLAAVTK
jgi:hypothetical protein